jgi:hypothetical protein
MLDKHPVGRRHCSLDAGTYPVQSHQLNERGPRPAGRTNKKAGSQGPCSTNGKDFVNATSSFFSYQQQQDRQGQ